MQGSVIMKKKDIRILLFFWDIMAMVLISLSVFMMFETVLKSLMINAGIDKYYDVAAGIKNEYKTIMEYINEKTGLDYRESMTLTLDYLKNFSLKKMNYNSSIVIIAANDGGFENRIGKNDKPEIICHLKDAELMKFYLGASLIPSEIGPGLFSRIKDESNENETKTIEYFYKQDKKNRLYCIGQVPDYNESLLLKNIFKKNNLTAGKRYMEFSFFGRDYIGVSQYLQPGIHSGFDRNNVVTFNPVLVIADLKSDFFSMINRVRNIFLIILGVIFFIIFLIKARSTLLITNEISGISESIKDESSAIEKIGLIGTALKKFDLEFSETSDLYESYSSLNKKLLSLGEIISGIADRELFVASLKNDTRILDPHRLNMSVLFLDVKNFTTIAEQHGESAMMIINHIWKFVELVVHGFNGKINKYIGDAALIIFPETAGRNARASAADAIFAGITILEKAYEISGLLNIDINFRIGIDCGKPIYGKTGTADKYELGVIGDTVNTASRFENLNKQFYTGILVSGNALTAAGFDPGNIYKPEKGAGKEFVFYLVDRARPHGKTESRDIFTVLEKNGGKSRLIGSGNWYENCVFDDFSAFLKKFIGAIKYWQSGDLPEGKKKWETLAREAAGLYNKSSLGMCEIFLNKLLTEEEYLRYMKNPGDWPLQEHIRIKSPDKDWIKYGTYELTK